LTDDKTCGTSPLKEDSGVMKARLARIAHVLAAVTSIALPASVAADPYAIGPPSGGYRPDNSEHTYCRGSD